MRDNPVAGALYFVRGFSLATRPGVRRFVIVPLAINVVVFAAMLLGAWDAALDAVPGLVDRLAPGWLPDWLRWLETALEWLLYPVVLLASLLAVLLVSVVVANLVAAPFNGLLAEAVERELTGATPDSRLDWKRVAADAGKAIASELRKLAYLAVRAVPLLALTLIPVLGLLASVAWLVFSAWMLSIEYLDYPMGNHGHTFPEQRERLAARRWLALGFGGAVALALTVPLLNFVVIPCAVAGATALWVERLTGGGEAPRSAKA